MKKLLSMLLTLCILTSLSAPVFAENNKTVFPNEETISTEYGQVFISNEAEYEQAGPTPRINQTKTISISKLNVQYLVTSDANLFTAHVKVHVDPSENVKIGCLVNHTTSTTWSEPDSKGNVYFTVTATAGYKIYVKATAGSVPRSVTCTVTD